MKTGYRGRFIVQYTERGTGDVRVSFHHFNPDNEGWLILYMPAEPASMFHVGDEFTLTLDPVNEPAFIQE